jgi:hypothetical protein
VQYVQYENAFISGSDNALRSSFSNPTEYHRLADRALDDLVEQFLDMEDSMQHCLPPGFDCEYTVGAFDFISHKPYIACSSTFHQYIFYILLVSIFMCKPSLK